MPKPSDLLHFLNIDWPYGSVNHNGAAFRYVAYEKVEEYVVAVHGHVDIVESFCWEFGVHRLVLAMINEASW